MISIVSAVIISFGVAILSLLYPDPILVRLIVLSLLLTWCSIVLSYAIQRKAARIWWLSTFVFVSLSASIAILHWPFRLAFQISKSDCDKLAQQAEKPGNIQTPRRIGSFVIREISRKGNGVIYLWLDTNPRGRTGFAYCSAKAIANDSSLWYSMPLADDWQFVIED